MQVRSLGQGDPLEEETATHSSILAWRIPWIEEPGEQQSLGLQRVGTQLTEHKVQRGGNPSALRENERTGIQVQGHSLLCFPLGRLCKL